MSAKGQFSSCPSRDFSDTKPASIQEPENFRHNEVAQRRTCGRLQRIQGVKELSKLFVGQQFSPIDHDGVDVECSAIEVSQ